VLHATLKNLLARRFRLVTTGIAVLLGVAFMAGTLVLGDTVTHTFDNLFSNVFKGTDAEVRAVEPFKAPDEGGGGQSHRRLGEAGGPTGVQHEHIEPGSGELQGRHAAARPTAHDHGVEALGALDAGEIGPGDGVLEGGGDARAHQRRASHRERLENGTGPSPGGLGAELSAIGRRR